MVLQPSPPEPAPTAAPSAEPSGWQRFDQSTPRAALQSLVHAFEKGNWDDLIRLVPASVQEDNPLTAKRLKEAWEGPMAEEIQRKMRAIARAITRTKVEQNGDRALLDYERGVVELIREPGGWKIKDL